MQRRIRGSQDVLTTLEAARDGLACRKARGQTVGGLLEARLLLVTGEAGGRHRRRCLDAPPRFDAGSRIVQQRPRRRRAARRRLSPCCYHGVVEDPWTPDASCPLGRRDRPSSPPPAFRGGYNARGTSGRQDRANRLRAPTLAVRFETAVIGPPPGPLAGFPSDAYFLSSLRFRRSAGIRPSTCRRAAVWHWAVTSLPRSSVARRGPSPSPRKTQSSPATDHPLPEMSKNRQGELDALTSERFTAAVKARNVVLITYRELITRQGLKAMRRPAG